MEIKSQSTFDCISWYFHLIFNDGESSEMKDNRKNKKHFKLVKAIVRKDKNEITEKSENEQKTGTARNKNNTKKNISH
uniref:Uncharacterized protein n=1 Tax=Romanomermis culicivorax TaxID=13658 RepID=A0A915KH44_ROMCU